MRAQPAEGSARQSGGRGEDARASAGAAETCVGDEIVSTEVHPEFAVASTGAAEHGEGFGEAVEDGVAFAGAARLGESVGAEVRVHEVVALATATHLGGAGDEAEDEEAETGGKVLLRGAAPIAKGKGSSESKSTPTGHLCFAALALERKLFNTRRSERDSFGKASLVAEPRLCDTSMLMALRSVCACKAAETGKVSRKIFDSKVYWWMMVLSNEEAVEATVCRDAEAVTTAVSRRSATKKRSAMRKWAGKVQSNTRPWLLDGLSKKWLEPKMA